MLYLHNTLLLQLKAKAGSSVYKTISLGEMRVRKINSHVCSLEIMYDEWTDACGTIIY
jgi:hypothetical protein